MSKKEYLKSKIRVPQVPHELLLRKSIADIIDNSSLDEVVCLIAPYGFGKTLAVISWLHERNRSAAWLTLDAADNSEMMFFSGLSAAFAEHAGGRSNADTVCSDDKYAKEPRDFLRKAIINAEKSDRDKILVIDNFQFLHDRALLRLIKDLICELLGSWRVIIMSRAELPPIFNDLMLKRHVCFITLTELSFAPEEVTEFFSINGCSVSPDKVVQISDETEGWPASLNVVLMLSRGGSVSYDEAAREYVMGFFETEIWQDIDDSTKEFLLKTSILDKLTPAACNAVTDMGATLPILRRLFVNGHILRLGEKDAYRYYRVFQNFLLYRLGQSDIDERKLYNKIAWRMFERDRFEQSFHYFFKANDMYGISQVLRIINSADMGIERYLELTGCLTSLNVEKLHSYPLIVAKIALIHYVLGNLTEMKRLYKVYLEWIEPGTLALTPEEYAECVWEAGWLSYLNPDEPVLNNDRHKEWFNYAEYEPRLKALHNTRAAVYRFPSMLRGVRDYCPVLSILDEFIQQNKDTDYGKIEDEVSLWRLDMVRAEYMYELEKFDLAEKVLRRLIAEVERRQITDLYFVCIALLVKIVRVKYDPKEIDTLTARLEVMIHKNGHTFLLPRFHAFELRNQLANGFSGQTEAFEKENKNYMEKPYFYLFYQHITLTRALLSTGNNNEALLILENLEHLCRQYNRIMDLIEVNSLKSIVYYRLGHEEFACHYLTEALNNAREYGFIRIFSDDAKELWPVLNLAGIDTNDDYVKSIIISCKKTLARAGIKPLRKRPPKSELTKTELKILKTLNVGLSYNEMALDNNIKVSTLKSHLYSIYGKLGVDNRTAAVMAARDKGIIE